MTDKTDNNSGSNSGTEGATAGTAGKGAAADEWLPPKMRGEVDIAIPYSNPPTDKLMEFYATWAENYDADLIDAYGYMAPTDAVAGMMTLGLAPDARILDAGCGTGQAGALLAAAGFTHVDGADLSPEMRDVAARLGVYRALYHLDMTADYAPQIAEFGGQYDAVICVGVFGYGPPHVEDLPRIMDAARPGA
ncbi:MAG: class I SAM-dependent DNA methyltransferase, partial [Candidatus Puniceispirillaceae bacterium]